MSEEKMIDFAKGKKCVNTDRSTNWAIGVFKEWMKQRNESCPNDLCPEDFLAKHCDDVVQLQKWLCRFVIETRRQDGEPYPPSFLQNLLSGVLTYMRALHGDTPDFLSKKDWRFRELRGTIESVFFLISVIKELEPK